MKVEEGDNSMSASKHVRQFQSRCKLEVEALHRVFVNWFRGLKPKDELRKELMDKLMPNFSHVAPNGQFIQGRSTLIQNLVEKYACFPKDQGFEIEVDNVKVVWKQGHTEEDGSGHSGGGSGAGPVIPGFGSIGSAHGGNDDDELSNYDGLILITFEEWHKWKEANGSISRFGRLSTCLLRERPTDGNFSWIHVHETWLQDTPLMGNGGVILDEDTDEGEASSSSDDNEDNAQIKSSMSADNNSVSKQAGIIPKHASYSDRNRKLPAPTNRKTKEDFDEFATLRSSREANSNSNNNNNNNNNNRTKASPADPTLAAMANSSASIASSSSQQPPKPRAAPAAPMAPKRVLSGERNSPIVTPAGTPAGSVAGGPSSGPRTTNSNNSNMFTQQVAQRNVSLRRHFSPQLPEYAKPFMMGSELLGVSISGWDIGTSQGPIGDEAWFAKAIENYEKISQCYNNNNNGGNNNRKRRLNLPEMVFPAAHVALEHRDNNLWISWDVLDALDCWAKAHQSIPVDTDVSSNGVSVFKSEDAALWKKSNKVRHINDGENNNSNTAIFHYDWTFSSPFCGAVDGGKWEKLNKSGIAVDLLKDKSQPILFFDEIVLYEDDLHDNGQVQFSIKIRVMPSCTFLLARMWVRIDRVLLRLRETRILINFKGAEQIYRDVTWRECKWEDLDHYKLPTNLRVWCREGNETPALASLLSRLPQVDPPKEIYRHAVLKLSPKKK